MGRKAADYGVDQSDPLGTPSVTDDDGFNAVVGRTHSVSSAPDIELPPGYVEPEDHSWRMDRSVEVKTVADLRAALADYPDDLAIWTTGEEGRMMFPGINVTPGRARVQLHPKLEVIDCLWIDGEW
jgi:hypothetical protein